MPLTAILVEDEAPARLLMRQYLADFPAIELVAECSDGLSAVAAIERLRPDLLFLDIQLPGLTGLEVLAQLTQVPPVIFSTAYDQNALAAFEAGAVDYLLKPYERSRFRAAAGRVLVRAATPSEALHQLLLHLAEKPGSPAPAGGVYPSRLFVPQGARLVAVPVREIHYAEAAGELRHPAHHPRPVPEQPGLVAAGSAARPPAVSAHPPLAAGGAGRGQRPGAGWLGRLLRHPGGEAAAARQPFLRRGPAPVAGVGALGETVLNYDCEGLLLKILAL